MENNAALLDWSVKKLQDMDPVELYEMLKLRADVFVIEQNCIYPDMDDKDFHALHVIGKKHNKVIACTRIFPAGIYFDEASIGRVVVKEEERQFKYGHLLMEKSLEAIDQHFGPQIIKISAQEYLLNFYKKHGFDPFGEGYLEDGIPHIGMKREVQFNKV